MTSLFRYFRDPIQNTKIGGISAEGTDLTKVSITAAFVNPIDNFNRQTLLAKLEGRQKSNLYMTSDGVYRQDRQDPTKSTRTVFTQSDDRPQRIVVDFTDPKTSGDLILGFLSIVFPQAMKRHFTDDAYESAVFFVQSILATKVNEETGEAVEVHKFEVEPRMTSLCNQIESLRHSFTKELAWEQRIAQENSDASTSQQSNNS